MFCQLSGTFSLMNLTSFKYDKNSLKQIRSLCFGHSLIVLFNVWSLVFCLWKIFSMFTKLIIILPLAGSTCHCPIHSVSYWLQITPDAATCPVQYLNCFFLGFFGCFVETKWKDSWPYLCCWLCACICAWGPTPAIKFEGSPGSSPPSTASSPGTNPWLG